MLYAYRAPPEIARPAIRCPVYSLHRAKLGSVRNTPTASHQRCEHPALRCGLITALMAGKMPEGTASHAILLHPSRDERLAVRPRKTPKFAHYAHPITNTYACHGRA